MHFKKRAEFLLDMTERRHEKVARSHREVSHSEIEHLARGTNLVAFLKRLSNTVEMALKDGVQSAY